MIRFSIDELPLPEPVCTTREGNVRPRSLSARALRTERSSRSDPRIALAVCVIGLMTACASLPGSEASSVPDRKGSSEVDPSGIPDEMRGGDSVETLGRARRKNDRLRFARAVLERKGHHKLDASQREGVARELALAEEKHGISVVLSLAIIELESRFDPNARGPAGSVGLMQLQPATARAVAKRAGLPWRIDRALLDPARNTRLGLAYLAELRERFGRIEHAVAAYNIGPANLRRLLARRPFRRGPYLNKVYAHVDALREEYGD